MKHRILSFTSLIVGMSLIAACGEKAKDYDATGTFEATETTIYAEQSGALLNFSVSEGDSIAPGQSALSTPPRYG